MELSRKEQESLKIMSQLSDKKSVPAIRLKVNSSNEFSYAFFLSDLTDLYKNKSETKGTKWKKETLPTH